MTFFLSISRLTFEKIPKSPVLEKPRPSDDAAYAALGHVPLLKFWKRISLTVKKSNIITKENHSGDLGEGGARRPCGVRCPWIIFRRSHTLDHFYASQWLPLPLWTQVIAWKFISYRSINYSKDFKFWHLLLQGQGCLICDLLLLYFSALIKTGISQLYCMYWLPKYIVNIVMLRCQI